MSKQHSVWHNGREYKWNNAYADFVYWFRTRRGNLVCERYSDVIAKESNEELAQGLANGQDALLTEFRKLGYSSQLETAMETMLELEQTVIPRLKELGRSLILDVYREPDLTLLTRRLDATLQTDQIPEKSKYSDYIVIDRRNVELKHLQQRRFYTMEGRALQDVDFSHGEEDKHFFPHIHLFDVLAGIVRTFAIRYVDHNVRIPYRKQQTMDGKRLAQYKLQSMRSGIEWREKRGYTLKDVERFLNTSMSMENMTLDELLILLSHGHEMEVAYKGWNAFLTPNGFTGFRVSSSNGERKQEYENIDIEDFAEKATIGPYYVKDIVGELEITSFF